MSFNTDKLQTAQQWRFSISSAYHENSFDCAKIEDFPLKDYYTDKRLSVNTLIQEVKVWKIWKLN